MHRIVVCSITAALAAILFTGCGESRPSAANGEMPKPGSYQQGGGISPFYAEELVDGRLYVFGSKKTWEKFIATKDMDPMNSKRLIGKGPLIDAGPKRMTLIVETTKDEPAKDKRIIATVANRYNLSL